LSVAGQCCLQEPHPIYEHVVRSFAHARVPGRRQQGQLLKGIRELYTGKVVAGHDLEIYRRACAQFPMKRHPGEHETDICRAELSRAMIRRLTRRRQP